jgi:hypothetical protein
MSLQKLLARKPTRTVEPFDAAPVAEPSPLAEQAIAFAAVAQKARDDCDTLNAEDELAKRGNRSGQ